MSMIPIRQLPYKTAKTRKYGVNMKRFIVAKNAMGMTTIIDNEKKTTHTKGVIAIFFKDEQYPQRSEVYASVSANALNLENDRRAKKGDK